MEEKNEPKDGKKMGQVTLEQAIAEPWRLDTPCTLDLGIGAKAEITEELAAAHENFWYWLNLLEDAEPDRYSWLILRDWLDTWVKEARTQDNMLGATAVYASVMRGILAEKDRAEERFGKDKED
ncbi:MAG TPA: hypothetical protein DC009_07610 [Porphyromonadaceae bacterium]|nr:hypothetical protein [Porphyromonadaceae bacterium]